MTLLNSNSTTLSQCCPIVKRGSRAAMVRASLKKSEFWPHITVIPLTINMRVERLRQLNDPNTGRLDKFNNMLTTIGDGLGGDNIELPPDILANYDSPSMPIRAVFGDVTQPLSSQEAIDRFGKRAILTPKNCTVTAINDEVIQPG